MNRQPPQPRRGQIWFASLPSDPARKQRPVVVVSLDARNSNPRAESVMVVPLTTSVRDFPNRIALSPGETGLAKPSMIIPDGITTLRKETLTPPRTPLRQLSERRLREIAVGVVSGMGLVVAFDAIQ